MILTANLSQLRESCASMERVLDVGGWHQPFNLATHVMDIMPYESRNIDEALDPQDEERFTQETWVIHDMCESPWPWPDKFFDFVVCSQTLEDIRDPVGACRELIRVAKAGYIEVPSRAREIFCKSRFPWLPLLRGAAPDVGFPHHRWFCEIEGSSVRFLRKSLQSVGSRRFYITRPELGRKMTEEESGTCLFWNGSFSVVEDFRLSDEDLIKFKKSTLEKLKNSGSAQ